MSIILGPSLKPVVLGQDYFEKIKTKKRKKYYFVVVADSEKGPRVNQYKNESEFHKGREPMERFFLQNCIYFSPREERKLKTAISLYGVDETWTLVASSESQRVEWLLNLQRLRPSLPFSFVCDVVITKLEFASELEYTPLRTGEHCRFCFESTAVCIQRLGETRPFIHFAFDCIRAVAHPAGYDFVILDLGRHSEFGLSKLWLTLDSVEMAMTLNKMLIDAFQQCRSGVLHPRQHLDPASNYYSADPCGSQAPASPEADRRVSSRRQRASEADDYVPINPVLREEHTYEERRENERGYFR